MTRSVSHFVAREGLSFPQLYENYLDYYESNQADLPYKLAFLKMRAGFLYMTFELKPGRYPVTYQDCFYNIAFPWQYLTLCVAPFSVGTPLDKSSRLDLSIANHVLTTNKLKTTPMTRSYLPPYLPNYDLGPYCIGWSHSVIQSSDPDWLIEGVNESFNLHLGLPIGLDSYLFATQWLFYKVCRETMSDDLYEQMTSFVPSHYCFYEWSDFLRHNFHLYLQHLEQLDQDWFLDQKQNKLSFRLDAVNPGLLSAFREQCFISLKDLFTLYREHAEGKISSLPFYIYQKHSPQHGPNQQTIRYSYDNPATWDFFQTSSKKKELHV